MPQALAPAAFGTVDLVLAAVLVLSMLVGLWRGLVREVMALAGWVAAYIAAQTFSGMVAPWVPVGSQGGVLNLAVTFVLIFVAALIVWALLTSLIAALVKATPLSVVDRLLGAVFGLARGLIVLLVAATVLAMTPAAQAPWWQQSQGAQWLGVVLQGLKPAMPEAVRGLLPA